MNAWIELATSINSLPNCLSLIITYPAVHETFMKNLDSINGGGVPLIYQNDHDLLNLVEILSKASFLI